MLKLTIRLDKVYNEWNYFQFAADKREQHYVRNTGRHYYGCYYANLNNPVEYFDAGLLYVIGWLYSVYYCFYVADQNYSDACGTMDAAKQYKDGGDDAGSKPIEGKVFWW